MSKSKIIMEVANNSVTVETALLRLKVILSSLENQIINTWINKELNGYNVDDEIPDYRLKKGIPYGIMEDHSRRYSNILIPIEHLEKKDRDSILEMKFYQSISSIEDKIGTSKSEFRKPIPKVTTQEIEKGIRNGFIIEMNVELDRLELKSIVSSVKTKILDVCLVLEKKFGNLDGLDISAKLDEQDIISTSNAVISIIYDYSVRIGDNNKIIRSEIGNTYE